MFKILLTIFILLNLSAYANEITYENDTQLEEVKELTFKEKSQETTKKLLKNKKTKTMFLSRHSLRKYYKQCKPPLN